MGRAEALSLAWDLLSRASLDLRSTVRTLDLHGLTVHAAQARALQQNANELYLLVRKEADAAHREQNPDAYDEDGRWIGNNHRGH
ncbi:hypothetical protein [Antribacter gilvus]|uniref:hypothetical protein n=1 Tax=Antribacter gilvus TaxID=2304675 RepID=UPI000F7AAE39|nr:hypothetical protein [Antribacter gilvus]